jgi:hypothetical protein
VFRADFFCDACLSARRFGAGSVDAAPFSARPFSRRFVCLAAFRPESFCARRSCAAFLFATPDSEAFRPEVIVERPLLCSAAAVHVREASINARLVLKTVGNDT